MQKEQNAVISNGKPGGITLTTVLLRCYGQNLYSLLPCTEKGQ